VGSFSLPAQLESHVNHVITYARGVVGFEEMAAVESAKAATTQAPQQGGSEAGTGVATAQTDQTNAIDATAEPAPVVYKVKPDKTVVGVLIGAAFSLMVSFALFLTVYCVVPNTRVMIGPASVGAAFAAVLWEAAKQGFALYVSYSKGYTTFYGALALLPMFLIWVYLTWLIVLFGLHVAHAMQSYRAATRQGLTQSVMVALGLMVEQQGKGVTSLDPSAYVLAMSVVGERFKKGASTEPSDIVEQAGLDEAPAVHVLDALAKAGMLHRVSSGAGAAEGGYVLSRPPEAIAISDILAVAKENTDRVKSPVAMRVLDSLARARAQAVQGRSLADALV
jgi:membrane protein